MSAPRLEIVVASRSAKKVEELLRVAAAAELEGVRFSSLADWEASTGRALPEVVEDAPDFAGNALKKAREVAAQTEGWVLADDSGLCVDALDGAPGVYSARYSGVEGPGKDAANNARLLEALAGRPEAERGARFVCALSLVAPDGRSWAVEGRCEGHISEAPEGSGGFGYDPLFVSHEAGAVGRSHGILSPAEKDQVSHRGAALRALMPLLAGLLPAA